MDKYAMIFLFVTVPHVVLGGLAVQFYHLYLKKENRQ